MEANLPSLRIFIINANVELNIKDNKGLSYKIRCWTRKAVIFLKEGKEKSGKGKEEDLCEGGIGITNLSWLIVFSWYVENAQF